jgi:hypothetical protein
MGPVVFPKFFSRFYFHSSHPPPLGCWLLSQLKTHKQRGPFYSNDMEYTLDPVASSFYHAYSLVVYTPVVSA